MKKFSSWYAIIFLLAPIGSGGEDDQIRCTPKDFGESSFVCVCTATKCDTLPSPDMPPAGQYLLYSSDKESHRFFKTLHSFKDRQYVCRLPPPYGAPNEFERLKADFFLGSNEFQHVMGWGGALSDSAAANIMSLPKATQDLLLSSYFSDLGLEYNFVRINIGGCDFSWRPYTYADTEDDLELLNFALQPEDTEFKIPLIHRIEKIAKRPIKLLGAPWTAPPWMKTNNAYVGGGRLKNEMYDVWADYFVKFLHGYKIRNVTMWGISLQNEPRVGNMANMLFNGMGWTAKQQKKWLGEYLGPTLEANGYSNLKILIMDDTRYELPLWPKTVLGDPLARRYAHGIGVHWYTNNWISPDKLDQVHEMFPEIFILNTEACEGNFPSQPDVLLGSWERAERYAREIIIDMNHWMNGWMDWNLALDTTGGPNWAGQFVDSSVIVNKEKGEFYKNPMFYALGHFSKFVQEGAVRLGLNSPDIHNLDATAFKNPDGTTVIVILNSSEKVVDANIAVDGKRTMHFTLAPRSLNTAIFL